MSLVGTKRQRCYGYLPSLEEYLKKHTMEPDFLIGFSLFGSQSYPYPINSILALLQPEDYGSDDQCDPQVIFSVNRETGVYSLRLETYRHQQMQLRHQEVVAFDQMISYINQVVDEGGRVYDIDGEPVDFYC